MDSSLKYKFIHENLPAEYMNYPAIQIASKELEGSKYIQCHTQVDEDFNVGSDLNARPLCFTRDLFTRNPTWLSL